MQSFLPPLICFPLLLTMGCGASTVNGGESDGVPNDAASLYDTSVSPMDSAGMTDGVGSDLMAGDMQRPMLDVGQLTDTERDGGQPSDIGRDGNTQQDTQPVQSICATALVIPLGDQVAYFASTTGEAENSPPCSSLPPGGPVRWFRFRPPANLDTRVTVTRLDTTSGRPQIRVFQCPPTSCEMSSINPHGLDTVTLRLPPGSRARPEYYVAVGAEEGTIHFAIGASTLHGTPAIHGSCQNALRVMNGTMLRAQSMGDAVDPAAWCGTQNLPALYYVVRVAARETLEVEANNLAFSGNPPTPGLFLASDCASTTCLSTGQVVEQGISRLRWANTASEPREVYLAVNNGELRSFPIYFGLAVRLTPSTSM
jgi:hypothetical protein